MTLATPAAIADLKWRVDQDLEPATDEALAVCLDRLWSVLEMPGPTPAATPGDDGDETDAGDVAADVWFDQLSRYPARVLSRAIDQLIAFYKYPSPPKPANVIEHIKMDDGYKRAVLVRTRLGMIERRMARAAQLNRFRI